MEIPKARCSRVIMATATVASEKGAISTRTRVAVVPPPLARITPPTYHRASRAFSLEGRTQGQARPQINQLHRQMAVTYLQCHFLMNSLDLGRKVRGVQGCPLADKSSSMSSNNT